jgi:hypothetical protein
MSKMQQHLLFYSNYCPFSKEVITEITKKNAKDAFLFVCVDTNRHRLPNYVDRVPTIVLTTGEILCDDAISQFLDSSSQSQNEPLSFNDIQSAYSGNFSLITENPTCTSTDNTPINNTAFAGVDQYQQIITPPEDGDGNAKDPYGNNSLDSFMHARENDIRQIYGKTQQRV